MRPTRDPWVAVEVETDPVAYAHLLQHVHAMLLAGERSPVELRDVILASWQRALRSGVDPERHLPPVLIAEDDVAEARRDHPLAPLMPALRELIAPSSEDSLNVMAVSDARGCLLWLEGSPRVKRLAEDIHFVEGALWSEDGAATNAIGTALELDHPIQVFSAEHFLTRQHTWTCACAPVHDPTTDELVGSIDLSGPIRTVHPHTLALVGAAARMAEQALASVPPAAARARPYVARPALALRLLGPDAPELDAYGTTHRLSLRRAEILALLALAPQGMTSEELAAELYGPDGNAISARAEISRLRRLLGSGLRTKPYRLDACVDVDLRAILRDLAARRRRAASRRYAGELLPRSDVPRIIAARDELRVRLDRQP